MGMIAYKYGSNVTKGKSLPHPAGWGGVNGLTDNYEVVKNVVLQVTDVAKNANKFYSLELQKNSAGGYRLFTHYGRTDDLNTKGNEAGTKECRYGGQHQCEAEFESIKRSKEKKGYKEVNLAKSKVGSDKAQGKSVGHVDQKTLDAMNGGNKKKAPVKKKKASGLSPEVRNLVNAIYQAAGQALTNRVNVQITADGFETPIGVLTIGQVDRGYDILSSIRDAIQNNKKSLIRTLSGDFYTAIPHNIGRTRAAIEMSVIDTIDKTDDVEETLQLMKDMLNVNSSSGVNLFAKDEVDDKYDALKTTLEFVSPKDPVWEKLRHYVNSTESKHHSYNIRVKNIWRVARHGENSNFNPAKLGNVKELFHGTRKQNVVGIMTRGLLMPNVAARHGAQITGAMFGPGLYFADQSTKSANYCGFSHYGKESAYMFVCGVALGNMKRYTSAQTQLRAPPAGYNSVLGEASVDRQQWGKLLHNEYIIFNGNQQELRYIIEWGV